MVQTSMLLHKKTSIDFWNHKRTSCAGLREKKRRISNDEYRSVEFRMMNIEH
jgi:hypothetical protein